MMGVEKTRFREGGRECQLGGLPLTTPSFLDKKGVKGSRPQKDRGSKVYVHMIYHVVYGFHHKGQYL